MSDLNHDFGGDLALSPSGDLALVDGADLVEQHVLRRLLTNPRDYIWHKQYGAGLARYVGQAGTAQRIQSSVLRQMKREASVSQTPPPTVLVDEQPTGVVTATISYIDITSGLSQTVTVPVAGG